MYNLNQTKVFYLESNSTIREVFFGYFRDHLASYDNKQAVFWFSGSFVSCFHLKDIPKLPKKQLQEVIAFNLEDELLSPMDEIMFKWIPDPGGEGVRVFALEKQVIKTIHQFAEDKKLDLQAILPDFTALEVPKGLFSLGMLEDKILFYDGASGFSAPVFAAELLLKNYTAEQEGNFEARDNPRLYLFEQSATDNFPLDLAELGVECDQHEQAFFEILHTEAVKKTEWDWNFYLKRSYLQEFIAQLPLLGVGLASFAACCLFVVGAVFTHLGGNKDLVVKQEGLNSIFGKFVGEPVPDDPHSWLDAEITKIEEKSINKINPAWLEFRKFGQKLNTCKQCRLSAMQFNEKTFSMKVEVQNTLAAEFKNELNAFSAISLQIESIRQEEIFEEFLIQGAFAL